MRKKVYNFSEKTLKERQRRIHLMMVILPLLILVFAYIFSSQGGTFDLKKMTFASILGGGIIFAELFILSKYMFKRLKEVRLIIKGDGFERADGKNSENINFDQIKSLRVKRNPNGDIAYIKVNSKGKTINITGFEDMDEIHSILSDNISQNTKENEKQYKIKWDSPAVIISIMLLTALVIVSIIKYDKSLYDLFNAFFTMGMGLVFTFYKPLVRNTGPRFRKFEIIISILLLGSGGMMFIDKVLNLF